MNCPKCGSKITVADKFYTCNCARVPKQVAGRLLSTNEVLQLITQGSTAEVLTGFTSRAGKKFAARLMVRRGKVVFDFPNSDGSDQKGSREAFIRAEAIQSGSAIFYVSGPTQKNAKLSFGLVSARLAECLALITATKYLQWACPDYYRITVTVSLNNLDFSRYVLQERKPRDKQTRDAVEYLLNLLDAFGSWRVEYKPRRRPRLHGSPVSNQFPFGVFPWLQHVNANIIGDQLEVELPDDPAVIAQFKASIRRADGEGCAFHLPLNAEKVVKAWLGTVKGGFGGKSPNL